MQDIFGQVHWRTLTIFDDKKAPEFCNAGAFLLAKTYSVSAVAGASGACAGCIALSCS